MRKPAGTNWGGYISTAGKALALATRVASLVNVEYKNVDTVGSGTITNNWAVTNLNTVAQGDDQTNRNGRSIKARGLVIQIGVSSNTTSTVPVRTRLVVVRDNFQDGTAPAGTDIYTVNGTEALRVITANQNRFTVLWDTMFTVIADNSGAGGGGARSIRKYLPLSHHIKYIGVTGAAASNGPGSLYFLMVCDNATAAQQPAISYAFRLRFIDN